MFAMFQRPDGRDRIFLTRYNKAQVATLITTHILAVVIAYLDDGQFRFAVGDWLQFLHQQEQEKFCLSVIYEFRAWLRDKPKPMAKGAPKVN